MQWARGTNGQHGKLRCLGSKGLTCKTNIARAPAVAGIRGNRRRRSEAGVPEQGSLLHSG